MDIVVHYTIFCTLILLLLFVNSGRVCARKDHKEQLTHPRKMPHRGYRGPADHLDFEDVAVESVW